MGRTGLVGNVEKLCVPGVCDYRVFEMNPLHKTVPYEQANRSLITDLLNPRAHRKRHGFALVATLSLMILLVVIAVGLLSLSAVTLRNSGHTSAQAEARANARMALMIAIGELQKQMGPDQRISANADIITESADESGVRNRFWMGAWDSWKAGLGEASQHSTIEGVTEEMAPTYAPNRGDHFRRWLVSLDSNDVSKISAATAELGGVAIPSLTDESVLLVGNASSAASDSVSARLLGIKDEHDPSKTKGRYGWWVGDESQKARVMYDSYREISSPTAAERIYRGLSPGSTGTKNIKDLEDLTDAQELRLKGLASTGSLYLVLGPPADGEAPKKPARSNFHDVTPYAIAVLSDVREGGLKRDLSTILEQPILRTNTAPEYMLYEFDDARFPGDRSHSRVPIQDLAAYYQLYDNDPTFNSTTQRREGVRYTSTQRANAIQLRTPDFSGGAGKDVDRQRFLREYTALYKQPVLIKVQFLMAMGAQKITPAERDYIQKRFDKDPSVPTYNIRPQSSPNAPLKTEDEYKLRLGLMPMLTFWNPNNLPLVMDTPQRFNFQNPAFTFGLRKIDSDGTTFDAKYSPFSVLSPQYPENDSNGLGGGEFLPLTVASAPIVFEPGEVKVISLPASFAGTLKTGGNSISNFVGSDTFHNTVNNWDPNRILLLANSVNTPTTHWNTPHVYDFDLTTRAAHNLVFNTSDKITFSVATENPAAVDQFWGNGKAYRSNGRAVTWHGQIPGRAFDIMMYDPQYWPTWQTAADHLRHFSFGTRSCSWNSIDWPSLKRNVTFNRDLMLPAMPGNVEVVPYDNDTNAILGADLIARGNAGDAQGLIDFTLSMACEASNSGGLGGGRRIASRPFLHSPMGAPQIMDRSDKIGLYNNAWTWQVNKINDVEDSVVTAEPGTGRGFYGGGYTSELGTTHVVQRQIPVLPALSIASLSHAHLGGFSLGYSTIVGESPETDLRIYKSSDLSNPSGVSYQKTSAIGNGGLGPHVVQAIGNSYAHPNLHAGKAVTTWQFQLSDNASYGGPKQIPFVDHSYLANKALWDEYFFSSITPQPSKVPLYGGTNLTAKQVADQFFKLNDPLSSSPLPNRRFKPYNTGLSQVKLDEMFTQSGLFGNNVDPTKNGLADKIAAHLMVEGAFNVNSTSVQAWKVFLSSLKGKPIAYLEGGTVPKEAQTEGTMVGAGGLPNAAPIKTADVSEADKRDQLWKTGRELTDEEIGELAEAMVKQVKLRGPFLSLSEFVNRRLDASKPELALKGALQAALDDPDVSINKAFREPGRILDTEFTDDERMLFAFPDAAKGPIAYGSMPYVDQADVLRGFAEQITARGDTFVIRTYGDSIDASGNVVARAWCEAVVQRLPEYVNPADAPHLKQADPALSAESREFGRRMEIVSFRWLNPREI